MPLLLLNILALLIIYFIFKQNVRRSRKVNTIFISSSKEKFRFKSKLLIRMCDLAFSNKYRYYAQHLASQLAIFTY